MMLAAVPAPALQPSGETQTVKKFYSIEGAVQKPGRFPLVKVMRVKEAIEAAGGLTKDADRKNAEIIRFNKRQKESYTVYFHVDIALSGDATDNFFVMNQDRIRIHSVKGRSDVQGGADMTENKIEPPKIKKVKVSAIGEISRPGVYDYQEGMTVADLVQLSGRTLDTSWPEHAQIVSTASDDGTAPPANHATVNLKKALENDSAHDLPLRPGDRLVVKSIPEAGKQLSYVSVSGEITLPGKYPIVGEERLMSVIARAGGLLSDANPKGAVVARERIRKIQNNYLDEIVARIEREHQAQNKNKNATQRLLEQIKSSKATGRIKAAVSGADLSGNKVDDIEMEAGDTLHVPSLSGTVRVVGAVKKQGVYEHNGISDYLGYIEAAGGYIITADEEAVFVIKADGSVRHVGKAFIEWSKKRTRLEIGGSKYTRQIIEPGDVIVAPELIYHPAWLREIRDHLLVVLYNGIIAPSELRQ